MSGDIHMHRCGLHLGPLQHDPKHDPPLAERGCGWEWEHERVFNNAEDYADRHRCPNCGAGPWYRRVLTPLQKQGWEEMVPQAVNGALDLRELAMLAAAIVDVLGFDEKRFQLIEARLIELKRK